MALLLVLVLAVSSAGFAQVKKVGERSAVVEQNKFLGLGDYAGTPTVKFWFTKDFSGEIGLSFNSGSGNARTFDSQFTILGKGDFNIFKAGPVGFHAGASLSFTSQSINGTTNTFIVGAYLGATAFLHPTFSVTADLYPISYTSISAPNNQSASYITVGAAALGAHYYF
jgi:hypothetical protein